MKKKVETILSYLFFTLGIVLPIIFVFCWSKGMLVDYAGRMRVAIIFGFGISEVASLYLGNLFLSLGKGIRTNLKVGMCIYFLFYMALVFFFTARSFNPSLDLSSKTFNLVPFKDTVELIVDVVNHGFETRLVMIFGNILLLVPLGFFLPRMFQKLKNSLPKYCLCVLGFALLVESVQLFVGFGVFDIDDVILNSLGGIYAFPLLNKCFLGRVLDRIFLLTGDKLSKKDIVLSTSLIGIVVSAFIYSIYVYWYKDPAIEISIEDDVETCTVGESKLYEGDYYEYYYPCENTDNLYVIFNRKKKFNLKDLMNGKVKTRYSVYFDESDLRGASSIEVKPKYPILTIEGEATSSTILYSIEDESIVHFVDSRLVSEVGGPLTLEVMAIPGRRGSTKVVFEIYDETMSKPAKTIEYEFSVDENGKVEYKSTKG